MENLKKNLEQARGTKELGNVLTKAVSEVSATSGKSTDDIKHALAKDTGVQIGTINQILKSKIKNPPVKRLDDFVSTLKNI
jgi:hypothetical protein